MDLIENAIVELTSQNEDAKLCLVGDLFFNKQPQNKIYMEIERSGFV